jgi:hypothetical protein
MTRILAIFMMISLLSPACWAADTDILSPADYIHTKLQRNGIVFLGTNAQAAQDTGIHRRAYPNPEKNME